ncbi:MAG: hypothetical protein U9Q37_02695 [Euryarchaeota archaeon]|nr:hypothetical protein [Euryarchaeota archaeon]
MRLFTGGELEDVQRRFSRRKMSISQLRIDYGMLAASGEGIARRSFSSMPACSGRGGWRGFWWLVCLSRVDAVLKLSRCPWQARARRFAGARVSGGGSA